jgi:hypothetical protein
MQAGPALARWVNAALMVCFATFIMQRQARSVTAVKARRSDNWGLCIIFS